MRCAVVVSLVLSLLSPFAFPFNPTCLPDSRAYVEGSEQYYVGKGIYHGVYDKTLALLPMAQVLRQHLVERLVPMGNGDHLDLGCGTGRIGVQVREKYPNTNLYGVDYSPDMAGIAILNGYPRGQVYFGEVDGNLKADAWPRHFPGKKFHNVSMNMVSYMMKPEELQAIFSNVQPLLHRKGRFVMTVLHGDEKAFLEALDQETKGIGLSSEDHEKVMISNRVLAAKAQKYDEATVRAMGERAGLRLLPQLTTSEYQGFATLYVFENP